MERELVELVVHAKRVLGTPYITINDRSFYVMLPYEAFAAVKAGDLTPEDFEKHNIVGNSFYIAEVTL
jgi:hypothetical protein